MVARRGRRARNQLPCGAISSDSVGDIPCTLECILTRTSGKLLDHLSGHLIYHWAKIKMPWMHCIRSPFHAVTHDTRKTARQLALLSTTLYIESESNQASIKRWLARTHQPLSTAVVRSPMAQTDALQWTNLPTAT